jgi:hypothetical protein
MQNANAADLRAYDIKIADAEQRLDDAHADADRQHLVPGIISELVTLRGNRAALEQRIAA